MEDIDGGLHSAVDGQSLDKDDDEEGQRSADLDCFCQDCSSCEAKLELSAYSGCA